MPINSLKLLALQFECAWMNDPIDYFNQKTLSYTYENGWSFSNFFDGLTRITEVASRGVLHETMSMRAVEDEVFIVAWRDEEMGPISQLIDMRKRELYASVLWEGEMQIWKAEITAFNDASDNL